MGKILWGKLPKKHKDVGKVFNLMNNQRNASKMWTIFSLHETNKDYNYWQTQFCSCEGQQTSSCNTVKSVKHSTPPPPPAPVKSPQQSGTAYILKCRIFPAVAHFREFTLRRWMHIIALFTIRKCEATLMPIDNGLRK